MTHDTQNSAHAEDLDYILDLIAELAKLARRADERAIAVHLEAILAAQDAPSAAKRL